MVGKMEETGASCITKHEGFNVCLFEQMGVANCVLPIQAAVWESS